MKNRLMLFAVAPLVQWQGYVDTYYAWDLNRPDSKERSYTTQPVKHDSFGVNLMSLGAKVEQGKKRAIVTFQFGDSVDSNYASEPNKGEGVKHVQEAYAGLKIGEDLWVDAGIYLGHIGNESWQSKDNWTYSRGLLADFSPYYAAGVRLSGKHGDNTWQLHLMNGWQNIKENNSGKALGTQYSWGSVTSNGFIGEEISPNGNSGLRVFHDLIWEVKGKKIDWRAAVDVGAQRLSGENKFVGWGGVSSQWRWALGEQWAQALRLDYLHDTEGVVAPTGESEGFRVASLTLSHDYAFEENALLRFEARRYQATDDIYSYKSETRNYNTVLTSNIALGF